MLIAPLYHQIGEGKYSNTPEMMEEHFAYLSKYPTLHPNDPLSPGINLCLTFDDATIDFYEKAYPLLVQYDLKALLAVPTSFIDQPGYCTWEILREMAQSGRIAMASHTHTHADLTRDPDLTLELDTSKALLEENLGITVDTFVYPYGKWNREVQRAVKKRFTFAMRIGSSLQMGWKPLMRRIPCDQLPSFRYPLIYKCLAKSLLKTGLHTLLDK